MLATLLASCTAPHGASPGTSTPTRTPGGELRWGPYKDASLQLAADPPLLQVDSGGRRVPLVPAPGALAAEPAPIAPGATLTLAFATGECGTETIAGLRAEAVARANVPRLEAAGIDFIVSTGGEGGRFTCSSAQGMEDFLAHFRSDRLVGIDLDIEGERTRHELDALARQVAAAQARHPRLRWSFTLPTFAGSDAVRAGLNPLGAAAFAAARDAGVSDFVVNLMVMDYGAPSPAVCVSTGQACDMARSAVQAAENLHAAFGVPFGRIALTAMIGRNDTAGSVTTLDDMRAIAHYARERGLAGVYYWSLDRDQPCSDTAARNDCSGTPYPPGAFGHALREALQGAP